MDAANRKVKLALLLNMIAPYRVPLDSLLADQFDLMVLHGGKEANRESWSGCVVDRDSDKPASQPAPRGSY